MTRRNKQRMFILTVFAVVLVVIVEPFVSTIVYYVIGTAVIASAVCYGYWLRGHAE